MEETLQKLWFFRIFIIIFLLYFFWHLFAVFVKSFDKLLRRVYLSSRSNLFVSCISRIFCAINWMEWSDYLELFVPAVRKAFALRCWRTWCVWDCNSFKLLIISVIIAFRRTFISCDGVEIILRCKRSYRLVIGI